MTIEILTNEMYKALKNKDKNRKLVISEMIAAIKNAAINNGSRTEITEELVNSAILKYQKTIQDMISSCPPERKDLLADFLKQKEIVNEFAPKIISDYNKIEELIKDLIKKENLSLDNKSKGKAMKLISLNFKGKIDLKVANSVVNSLFN